ncbi:class I adenylate-forming enzyme family protein [Nocardioides nitrophenolicus]|uniref:class I adenylate-forming enzyme family protein n=1 Tax=Nocardioides nitrophenolicus TaxID=60489 RepID=UPI001958877E|nr:AMP-binding protein [Nocardioides nitrophenolicus]MBM7517393.1 long-chain acyl-CoA synthetase [Nocardioides nitrophenolicus]
MTTTLAAAWWTRVAARPDRVALSYAGRRWTVAELDADATALAAGLAQRDVRAGDRVVLHLQNVPAFPLALLALWRLGAVGVLANPMYRDRELRHLLTDSGAVGVITSARDIEALQPAGADTAVGWWLGVADDDPTLAEVVAAHAGAVVPEAAVGAGDLALLTYTSGTTGPPKGAMNTHANVLATVERFGAWIELTEDDVVYAAAPLFHITGAVASGALALVGGASLALSGRFDPAEAVATIEAEGATFTIASITAFHAIEQVPGAGREQLASLRAVYTGGAPVPQASIDRFRDRFGVALHNVYGMTETTSAVVAVPLGVDAPVDPTSGAVAIGRPLPGVGIEVRTEDGAPAVPGEPGELVLTGDQVVPGYWGNLDASARTMPSGRLHTGDVAVVDADGWVYLVDRLKDQINVSGYKVWPREVEDVLYEHPAVHEAAVVGRPDEYRGEVVVAHVVLAAGRSATPEELIAHTRSRLAAYKAPREVHLVAELPKTATGKIRRDDLRG